jgi:hypothetical protein
MQIVIEKKTTEIIVLSIHLVCSIILCHHLFNPTISLDEVINFGNMFIVTNSDGTIEGISFFSNDDKKLEISDRLIFEVRDLDGKLDSVKRGLRF